MPEQGEKWSPKDSFNAFYFAVSCYAWAILPITRSGIGKRALGLHAFVAMIGMLWYGARHHSKEMYIYFWCWVGCAIYRRLTANKNEITEYQGKPFLTMWLVDEIPARLLEAILVWIVGNYLMPVSEPLGRFLAYGGLALGLKYAAEWLYLSRIDDAMHDAERLMKARMAQAKRR